MPLAPGTRIGAYEVVEKLGEGGMGEVYRATDTRLKRQVAIKILPEAVEADPDRLVRFEREAELLASLNHPNIAAIYGVEDAPSSRSGQLVVHALVMELVEGPTLAELIASAQGLPIDDALRLARQVADAVASAHEQHVVHRDLKPANIKVKPDGSVKVLDFGLAKALDPSANRKNDPGSADGLSSTLTSPALMTHPGIILGTAAYMSPEQARAQAVDKRADIWAFGAILYEMLTGRRAFGGQTMSDTIAAVLDREPDWSALPASTPLAITRVLRQCLQKDVRQRRRDIGDIAIELQDSLRSSGQIAVNTIPIAGRSRARTILMYGVPALVLGGVIAASVMYATRATTPEGTLERVELSILPPAGTTFPVEDGAPWPSISPDSRRLAFAAVTADGTQHLYTRDLDSASPHLVEHSDGAARPFWSPDSRAIGFFADEKIKRIDLPNGMPQVVCDAPYLGGMSASWGSQGTILFNGVGGWFRVPASGGTPQNIDSYWQKSGFVGPQNPSFLPDGKRFVFVERRPKREDDQVCVGSLDETPPHCIATLPSPARYAGPGYLLYVRDGVLRLQPFALDRLSLSGESTPVSSTFVSVDPVFRPPPFSISPRALAYHPGTGKSRLVWMDRTGRVVSVVGESSGDTVSSVSRDGTRIVVSRPDLQHPGNLDLWTRDSTLQTWSRFTFGPEDLAPIFSADGARVVYLSRRDGASNLFIKPTNGLAPERQLTHSPPGQDGPGGPVDWSADGRWILYNKISRETSWDIWMIPADGGEAPQVLVHGPGGERNGNLSPDMKWITYDSTESGRRETWIQPMPPTGSRWQVSTTGGFSPRWRGDGRELFYIAADGKMMAAAITPGPTPVIGAVTPLFQTLSREGAAGFRVSSDGQRFLINAPPDLSETDPITVVVNWSAMVRP